MSYKREVFEALKDLGVPTQDLGYHYISSIVEGYLTGKYTIHSNIIDVYHTTAKEFNSTGVNVERCIRHSVGVCLSNIDNERFYKYFGNRTMCSKSGRVKNSAFISSVVVYIKACILSK